MMVLKNRLFRMLLFVAITTAIMPVAAQKHIPNAQIYCRDPFITVDREAGCYYLIVSRSDGKGGKLFAYKSTDLEFWDEVGYVCRMPEGFRGVNDWWAPDTYLYNGAYYCFVTVSNFPAGILRGTTIFRSDNGLAGDYRPHISDKKLFITPAGMQCLDGSLYIDEKNRPWLFFCVEWNGPNVKNKVGEIWCSRLNKKLDGTKGKPHSLFAANEAKWPVRAGEGVITDAPFLWRDKESGNLLMLWSSFAPKYSIGQAVSRSGSVFGPWEQQERPIFSSNGGHQMVFEDLQGNLRISFHSPNERGSHLVIAKIRIKDGLFQPIDE